MRTRRAPAMLELSDPARIRFLAGRGVHGIKANPGYASGPFHQTTHDLAAFPGDGVEIMEVLPIPGA